MGARQVPFGRTLRAWEKRDHESPSRHPERAVERDCVGNGDSTGIGEPKDLSYTRIMGAGGVRKSPQERRFL